MSVVVKGMKFPENCAECELWAMDDQGAKCPFKSGYISDGDWDLPSETERGDWCPLHPLPEKHGRIIDADALSDEYALITCEIHGFRIETLGVGDEHATLKFKPWREVPTIVEVEG